MTVYIQQRGRPDRSSSWSVPFLRLLGAVVLGGLGACAQQQTPVVTTPSLVASNARLTTTTLFQINTRVFLVKKPERISALKPYHNTREFQTHVLSAHDGKALMAVLEKSRYVTIDESGGGSTRTVAGQPAVYEAIRELIYPVEYDPPQLSKRDSAESFSAFPVTPAHPVTFENRNCGFQSRVTPIVTKGGELEVRLMTENTTFDGFVNYGSPITTAGSDWLGEPVQVVLTENRIEMPVFTTGKVENQVKAKSTDYIVVTGLPQGRPLNATLTKPGFGSGEPLSNTEARKPYQLVVMHEVLALAE